MPTKKQIDKFITENRDIIDEFIGPNHDQYVLIVLKGQLSRYMSPSDCFALFEQIIDLPAKQQNRILRKELEKYKK